MTSITSILRSEELSHFIEGASEAMQREFYFHVPQLLTERFDSPFPKCAADLFFGSKNIYAGVSGLCADYSEGDLSLGKAGWRMWQTTVGAVQVVKAAQRTPLGELFKCPALDIGIGVIGIIGTTMSLRNAARAISTAQAATPSSDERLKEMGKGWTNVLGAFYGFQRNSNRISNALGRERNFAGDGFLSGVNAFLSHWDGPLIVPEYQDVLAGDFQAPIAPESYFGTIDIAPGPF